MTGTGAIAMSGRFSATMPVIAAPICSLCDALAARGPGHQDFRFQIFRREVVQAHTATVPERGDADRVDHDSVRPPTAGGDRFPQPLTGGHSAFVAQFHQEFPVAGGRLRRLRATGGQCGFGRQSSAVQQGVR